MKIFDDILDNTSSSNFERAYFANNQISELEVINYIGRKIAKSFLKEFGRFCPETDVSTVLAVIGTGHNAADALAFLIELSKSKRLKIDILTQENANFKENTKKHLAHLQSKTETNIFSESENVKQKYNVAVEGISGMSYSPPLRPETAKKIDVLNRIDANVKIAIDLPIGLSDTTENTPIFNADVIYATAIAKESLFKLENRNRIGRIRYISANFFNDAQNKSQYLITRDDSLAALSQLRNSCSDKRTYGKVLIVSGAEKYAGAALLNASTAIRSGAGFVYACVPETFKPAFCATEPSVIWHSCAVDESGAIALENFTEINALAKNADAILAGSGLTNSRESSALVAELLKSNPDTPAILDADAINHNILQSLHTRNTITVLTPHEGEFLRIAKDFSNETLLETARNLNCVIMLKSNITRISDGETIAFSTRGCPALARAGSGDILCALTASLLANKTLLPKIGEEKLTKKATQKLCAIASQWLGASAEVTSSQSGELALASSDIIKHLPKALQ